MSRPRSESEYLARLIPPSVAAAGLSRRGFLKGTLGAGAALSLSGLLAACGGDDEGGGGGGSASQEVTFGSNQSDKVPKKAYADMLAASGLTVKVNTVDHENFQENINNYLQGNPDDVFTWFAGYRMRFFAAQGLAGDISDVWGGLTGMNDALKQASTGDDGKQYFVPLTTYPWALFYRKSVWEEKGYEPPQTLDELVTLSKQMQKDGLVPIAFADKDGCPAMGTGAIEAPIDGFMMRAEPKNEEGAKALLKYLGTAKAEDIALKADPTVIGASSEADTSSYTALQKKAVEFIGSAESIAQFLDRDTRPDFASTVMLPGIQTFLKNPDDIDGLTKSLESQKKSIFTS
jgi:ABC-type glycerol-3-phosphate transport system substrate-binding protein